MSSQTNVDMTPTKTETAVDKAQDAAAQVKDKAGETATLAKEQAMRAATQVTDQAKATVESRMSDVAQELGNVADVVRQTTHDGGLGTSDTVVRYGERIADQIEGVSSYLDEHGVEEILTDIQDFARRQPAVFLGGAFMLGIVVGRFLRSTGGRSMGYDQGVYDRYQSSYGTGGGQYGGSTQRTGYDSSSPTRSTGSGSGASGAAYSGSTGSTGSTGSDSNLTGSAYSGTTGSTGSNSNTIGASRTGPGTSSATKAGKPGYNPANGDQNSSGSVGSAGQEDYKGRNRYQTGITQESTTTQDES